LRSERLALDDFEGSKYVCSPPLRHDQKDLEAMWRALGNGTVTVFSSDHCPDSFDHPCGKQKGLRNGKACFKDIPNGVPGVETRLPLLFHHAGNKRHNRISLPRFVELTATNPAKMYGLSHLKGGIAPGLDADLVIWYPEDHPSARVTITQDMLHHAVDYTPFEGLTVKNWPRWVFLRGDLAWDRDNGGIVGDKGKGEFLKRAVSTMMQPSTNPEGMLDNERESWL
jgi:dihydropyrimidinase